MLKVTGAGAGHPASPAFVCSGPTILGHDGNISNSAGPSVPLNFNSPGTRRRWPVTADLVMRSFNVRSLRRERPDNPDLMRQIISEVISVDAPLSFVSYWGKGPRSRLARPDVQCLDLLASMVSRIHRVYPPGATIRLVFTDTHAELNGHSPESMRSYFGDVETAARNHGFETCLLTDVLWTAELLGGLRQQTAPLNDDLLRRLVAFATKWYRGGGKPEHGAREYYRLNMMEKQAVELAFPRCIFITFNSSDVRTLLPDRLPVFFMYSIKRGVSNKPWFLPDPAIAEAMTGT